MWRCLRCGDCCKLFVFSGVIVTEEEYIKIATFVKEQLSLNKFIPYFKKPIQYLPTLGEKPPKICIFQKNNTCMIHPCRPQRCKEYPMMVQENEKQLILHVSEDCRGCEEILSILRTTPPLWIEKKAKNKEVKIVTESFYEQKITSYYDEEG